MADVDLTRSSDLQVWPIGVGCVAVGFGKDAMLGSMILAAVPDHLIREDWRTVTVDDDLWNQLDGPMCILRFKDREAVDRFIGGLEQLKAEAFGSVN